MKIRILLFLLGVLTTVSATAQSAAEWNAYKAANGINPSWSYNAWLAAGMPRGGGTSRTNTGPSAADIAMQQRNAAANAQQQLAIDAYNRGDFATAEAAYRKCLI